MNEGEDHGKLFNSTNSGELNRYKEQSFLSPHEASSHLPLL